MVVDTVKKARGKKGDGPVIVSYISSKNEESSRVSADVEQIKVADRHGKSKLYAVNSVGASAMKQLAAFALAKKIDLYVRNTSDGKDVLACADAQIANLKDGKFYAKGEGKGGPGRSFDTQLWIDTIVATAQQKKKPLTEKQIDQFGAKLMSLGGKERREFCNKLLSDPVFKVCQLNIKSKRASAEAKKGSDYDALAAF